MDGIRHFLDSESLARLASLQVRSRYAVEGASAGGHRSRRKGVSVEFADYRQYAAGDDLKRIDWRVFGKSERLYLRQSEEETSLQVQLFVDKSASMNYKSGKLSKFDFASTLAAAVAYSVCNHQDAAGLALFDEECRLFLPPKSGAEHLRVLCNVLHDAEPDQQTHLADSLHVLAERIRRRGLVILISDLLDSMETASAALSHFRRKGHDVVVYHVLDRAELDFPFIETASFTDLESNETISATPREIRSDYKREINEFQKQCRQMCNLLGADYQLAVTDSDLVRFLTEHWSHRA